MKLLLDTFHGLLTIDIVDLHRARKTRGDQSRSAKVNSFSVSEPR